MLKSWQTKPAVKDMFKTADRDRLLSDKVFFQEELKKRSTPEMTPDCNLIMRAMNAGLGGALQTLIRRGKAPEAKEIDWLKRKMKDRVLVSDEEADDLTKLFFEALGWKVIEGNTSTILKESAQPVVRPCTAQAAASPPAVSSADSVSGIAAVKGSTLSPLKKNKKVWIIAGCIAVAAILLILFLGGGGGNPSLLNGEWESISIESTAQNVFDNEDRIILKFSDVGTSQGVCRLSAQGYGAPGSVAVSCSVRGNIITLSRDGDSIDMVYSINRDHLTLKGNLFGEGDITIRLKKIR